MFVLTYDLINHATEDDYEQITKGIKSNYPNSDKLTESCWLIYNAQSQGSIMSTISKYVKSNDRLVVAELKSFPLARNSLSEINPLVKLPRTPHRPIGGL
jgi:cobalamin biosynthesis Co2+ chelatase CbiK